MTNKEAIDYLAIIYERSRNGKRAYHNKYQDAFDMAIEALKIEPCDDVVSRKAAIEAVEFGITYAKAINKSTGEVKELFKEGNKALNEAVERLKELPPAQPETHEERTETHECDYIERQAVIDVLHGYFDGMLETDTWSPCVVFGLIENLPSAQPEIVHCKDCKHYIKSESYCDYLGITISDHDYCSFAEGRADE